MPRPATDGRDSIAARLLAWLPALLLAQLVLALWWTTRALPAAAPVLPVLALALGGQMLFLLRALPLLCLLAWLLAGLRSRRAARLAVALSWSAFLLWQALLEQYFLTAGVPLGADLFGYSLTEIRTTLGGAGADKIGRASCRERV